MNQAIQPDPRIASLEAENQALRARMAFLLEQVERNHDIMCRHQAFDLEIVSASTFPELIGTIFRTLPVISDLDGVTLSLLDEDDDIVLVMEKLGVDFSAFPQLLFVHAVAELGLLRRRPWPRGRRPCRRCRCSVPSTRPCMARVFRRSTLCAAWRWCPCCATSA